MIQGEGPSISRLYLAGTGMITAAGPTAAMTYTFFAARRSGYEISEYRNKNKERITMALVPDGVFDEFELELEICNPYNAQFDHILKLGVIAALQACEGHSITQAIPLMLAMPEPEFGPTTPHGLLTANLAEHCAPAFSPELTRSFHSGRAAGIEAIDFAFHYLHAHLLIMIGASDSPIHPDRIEKLNQQDRLLTSQSRDSFAPGEGAAFLLLTSDPQFAMVKNNHIITLHPPGIAEETGHMYSQETYRGEGLDQAFKKALAHQPDESIDRIFSSMNGENFWAKEYGVAYLRSKIKFTEAAKIEHPADCYGDLGCATATALIAMAAEDLWKNKRHHKHLVYSSSDTALRGALVIEKLAVNR